YIKNKPTPVFTKCLRLQCSQSGTNAPSLNATATNNTGATISFTRSGTGAYQLVASTPIFAALSNIYEKTGSVNYAGKNYSLAKASDTALNFSCFSAAGAAA